MKFLFIGSISPKCIKEELLENGVYEEYAADTFQQALLSGFEDNGCEVDLITAPSMMSYPKYGRFMQRGFSFSRECRDDFNGESVGFINLPVVKLVCKFINLSFLLRRKKLLDMPIVIYGATSFQLLATTIFARKNKKYLIVPDLPEFMSGSKNIIYRALKRIDRRIINHTLKYIDGFVLLSKAMAAPMKVGNKPQVLVEGLYTPQDKNVSWSSVVDKHEKVVLYTGKIEERFGLRDLLEAFSQIHGDEYKLWICGGGEVEMLKEYISKDDRIVYFGTLPRESVLKKQREATLLVNPRHSNEEFTKYSFPSKTMEYMASGTPTLMCKLESIPESYHRHLFFFEDESIAGMRCRIQELLDSPQGEMRRFGESASRFIIENKNAKVQTLKIVEMIKK